MSDKLILMLLAYSVIFGDLKKKVKSENSKVKIVCNYSAFEF